MKMLKFHVVLISFLVGSPLLFAFFPPAEAASPATQRTASEAFKTLSDDYWETSMRLSPLTATFLNHPRYHDRLDDNTPKGREKEQEEFRRILAELNLIDRAALSQDEKLSWDIMKLLVDMSLESYRYRFWEWNVDHMDGFHTWIPSVIETAQPMKTQADAEAYIARLQAMPRYFQNHVDSLRQGLQEGRAAVQIAVERTLRQLEEFTKTPPEQTPYALVAKKLPEDLRARYEPRILDAIRSSVYPAHETYLKFLKEEYSAKARGDDRPGLFYVAGSSGAYSYLIRLHTTLDKAPAELYKAGMDELKDIQAEMEQIAKKRGHTGDLKSFFDKIRKDPGNFFKTRQDVLETAQRLVAKTQEKLPQYFGRIPKTPLTVKMVEEYREKNIVAALYYPPPDDLSRPGIYYINTYQPETRPRFGMAALAVHEGLPGHHLQMALALEKRDLPAFRRNGGFNSFVEGWALYSERLAEEMGIYPDDLSRLGMLSFQAWRACRLVVDTGLHARGWARWRAIDFMKQNTPMSEAEIIAEVDRYIVIPGQALAYKVGQREILSLRRESQALLKQKFDLRAFHDRVLENGALPLTTLRRIVLAP